MSNEELLTANKIAEKIGVPPKIVKDYLTEKNIEPDQTKGACKYYGSMTIKKIEKELKQ